MKAPAEYSYRLGDPHDSVHRQAVHLLSFHVFGEQLQHGGVVSEFSHLLNHPFPDA